MEKSKIKWEIEFDKRKNGLNTYDIFFFHKYVNDKISESYRPCNKDEAMIFFSCIINGFDPPKTSTNE